MVATEITSAAQLQQQLEASAFAVVLFHTGGSRVVQLFDLGAARMASADVALLKCNTTNHSGIAQQFNVTVDPTFITFRFGTLERRFEGEDALRRGLDSLLSDEAPSEPSGDKGWVGSSVAKGWSDITSNVEFQGLDIMNANTEFGGPRTLFDESAPSELAKGKGKEGSTGKDWVESDTDEQLMLFVPFQGAIKLHSFHITSLASTDEDEDDDEVPSRPKTIKLFTNTAQILGFEDAESRETTQVIELKPEDWDAKTKTVVVNTRFVKFQSVSALTIFFVDVERDGAEKVRIDRLRIIGEKLHEKVDMHKLKPDKNEE